MPLNLKPRFSQTAPIPAGHLGAAAQQAGLHAQELLRSNLGTLTAEDADPAAKQHAFGSPTCTYKGARFWSQDRLDFLDCAVAGVA
jgi:2-hydroxychromene-2-carboxylate isomerase